MESLLILKSIVDGLNITLCGTFFKNSSKNKTEDCDVFSDDNHMGGFLTKEEIDSFCKEHFESSQECHLNITI